MNKLLPALTLACAVGMTGMGDAEAKSRFSHSKGRPSRQMQRNDHPADSMLNSFYLSNSLVTLATIDRKHLNVTSDRQFASSLQGFTRDGTLVPSSDPRAQRVTRITHRLLQSITHFPQYREITESLSWQIALVDSPTLNAYCMPSGKIVVYTGIIDKLSLTDDELAAIIGHEIAHALEEHSLERIRSAALSNAVIGATGAILWKDMTWARLGNELHRLSFSRENETESDTLWVQLSQKAGFNSCGAVSIWKKMHAHSAGQPPEILSTHPSNQTRIRTLQALTQCH